MLRNPFKTNEKAPWDHKSDIPCQGASSTRSLSGKLWNIQRRLSMPNIGSFKLIPSRSSIVDSPNESEVSLSNDIRVDPRQLPLQSRIGTETQGSMKLLSIRDEEDEESTRSTRGSIDIDAELAKTVAERDRLQTTVDKLKRRLRDARAENARLSEEQATQVNDAQKSRKVVVRLKHCLGDHVDLVGDLRVEVEKKRSLVRTLKEENGALRKEVLAMNAEVNMKGRKISLLVAQERELQEELARVKARVNKQARMLSNGGKDPELERQVLFLKTTLGKAEVKNKSLEGKVASMKVTIEEKAAEVSGLNEEIEDLQDTLAEAEAKARKVEMGQWEWDLMCHKVSRAEARMRVLDNVSRFKVQARLESSFVPAKKSPMTTLRTETTAVEEKIRDMNEKIRDLSSTLLVVVEGTGGWGSAPVTAESSTEATPTKQWVGLTRVLTAISTISAEAPVLALARAAFEMFFVHWCVDIVEANYPDQPSFANFLIDVCHAQSVVGDANESGGQPSRVTPATCIPHRNVIPPPISPTSYATWTKDVMSDLASWILAPLRVNPLGKSAAIEQKISQLLEIAYDLRLGLAEKQSLGSLELSVVGSGTPFREGSMDDAFADRDVTIGELDGFRDLKNLVLGTTGLGLQRDLAFGQASIGPQRSDRREFQKVEILVKPQVFVCR